MAGGVTFLAITSGAGGAMQALESVAAEPGRGLAGDRYAKGTGFYSNRPQPRGGREITLFETEVLEALCGETGIALSAAETRRNVTTRGIRLDGLIGVQFRIGDVLCEGIRPCDPCLRLEELTGKAVLKPLIGRGGLRANVLSAGVIHLGDAVHAVAITAAAPVGHAC